MVQPDAAGRRIRNDVSGLIGAFLIVAALYFAREVLNPLCLAGLITFLLAPLATWLERRNLPRTVSGMLVIGMTAIGICSIGWVVLGQVYNLAIELPQYQNNVTHKIDALHLHSAGKLASTVQMLSEVSRQISNDKTETASTLTASEPVRRGAKNPTAKAFPMKPGTMPETLPVVRIEEPGKSLATVAAAEVSPIIGPLASAFAVVIFVVFMLLAREDIRDRAVRLIGSTRIHVTTVAMVDAATRVSRYLLMQFVVNLGYGVVVGFALWAIGIPHPLLWAVTTFLFRFVPYVGILAAGAAPILVALAISPNWAAAGWTFGLYVLLELIAANAVEPFLYGSSTGVSALAILVAAIFWTWLWGIPGLLLSTPLTVCLIVVGQHVPRLEFLGILFSEKTVLDPSQRLYQRLLASDVRDAGKLLEEEIRTSSRDSVYDKIIIPTLSLVEEARHTEQLDSERAEIALQQIEDLVEEQSTAAPLESQGSNDRIVCVAVKDLADDIACELIKQVLSNSHKVETLASGLLSADVVGTIERVRPKVVCVVGVPPQAIRHIRVRCHQLRARFPDVTIVACVLSTECDLANVRGRIPIDDADHVVCSLHQAQGYLNSLGSPSISQPADLDHRSSSLNSSVYVPLDESSEVVFAEITNALARTFEAPIALIQIQGGENDHWQAQCGRPESESGTASSLRDSTIFVTALSQNGLIVPDIAENVHFSPDAVLLEQGIRFFAAEPVLGLQDEKIGSLCVFDTRPRQITHQQEETLKELARAVTTAIAVQQRIKGETKV